MGADWFRISMLIVLWGFADVSSGPDCESGETAACEKEFADLVNFKEKFKYAVNKYTLVKMCRLQDSLIECLAIYAAACLSQEEQGVFNILTNGSNIFVDNFCKEGGSLNKEYLKYSMCIHESSSLFEKCAREYEVSQKILEEDGENKKFKQQTCCLYFENISCSANATLEKCGEEASQLVAELWKLLGGTYLNDLCEPFSDKFESGRCLDVSTGSRTDPRFLTVILSLLYGTISLHLK